MKVFLSNCLSAYPLQTIKRRKKGSKESDTVVCPLIVKSCNEYMGGVDIMDQKKVTKEIKEKIFRRGKKRYEGSWCEGDGH